MEEQFINIYVNEKFRALQEGLTILQACGEILLDIPRFCYHERLSIAGNCRMCMVEVDNNKKLVVACAVPIVNDLKISTFTLRVKIAREAVLEFLLVNHPLDCPICDQAGECDLQDLSLIFGSDRGRFYGVRKRVVEDKNIGSLIKMVMNRCIHCTRCIRFLKEIAKVDVLGLTGRGSKMHITTYVNKIVEDPYSGNVIDLCPVGALTSKPYAFKARSWEIKSIETIDLMDVFCMNVRMDVLNNKIIRILPRSNEGLDEEWITNVTRFFYDSLEMQRYTKPILKMYRKKKIFINNSWFYVYRYLQILYNKICKFKKWRFVLDSSYLSVETLLMYNYLTGFVGYNSLEKQYVYDMRNLYTVNIKNRLKTFNMSSFIVSLGLHVLPLIEMYLSRSENAYIIGLSSVTRNTEIVSMLSLKKLSEGKSNMCKSVLNKSIFVLAGDSIWQRRDNLSFFNIMRILCFSFVVKTENIIKNMISINWMQQQSGNIGASDLGLNQYKIGEEVNSKIGLTYVIGTLVENYWKNKDKKKVNKDVYIHQSFFGNNKTANYDIVLPVLNSYEEEGKFFNIEALIKKAKKVLKGLGFCKSEKKVLSNLSFILQRINKMKNIIKNLWTVMKIYIYYFNVQLVPLILNKYGKENVELIYDIVIMVEKLMKSLSLHLYDGLVNNLWVFHMKELQYVYNKMCDLATYNYYASHALIRNSSILSSCAANINKKSNIYV